MMRLGALPFDPRRTPVTVGFIAALAVGFLVSFFLRDAVPSAPPLSFLTYPFIGNSFYGLVFGGLWVWFTLGSLERGHGWTWAATLLAAAILVFPILALALAFGGRGVNLFGALLPIAAITMVWCAENAEAEIRLMGVLPVKGKWLALIEAGAVLFGFGAVNLVAGAVFTLALGGFWLVGQGRIPIPSLPRRVKPAETKQDREFDRYRDEIYRREKEREEKERLRKLFESSLRDDPEDKG